jgi:acyl-coenzyme A thioesterase PaaI-like protein
MTDISGPGISLPGRLGVGARFEDDHLIIELRPQGEALHHGMVRASVLAFVVDVVAGIPLDQDADMWTLTSDMSVHMRPLPAPERIDATSTILRQGRRSATSLVEMRTDAGAPIATGAIGFVNTPRKESDPPKPKVLLEQIPLLFRGSATLARPLREEAGIQVIDAAEGIVQVEVTPELRNPAGTLQGAMVAASGRGRRRRPGGHALRVVLRSDRPRPPLSPEGAGRPGADPEQAVGHRSRRSHPDRTDRHVHG